MELRLQQERKRGRKSFRGSLETGGKGARSRTRKCGREFRKGQQVERQRRIAERRLRALVTFSLGHHQVKRETYQMCPTSQMRGIPVHIVDRASSCEVTLTAGEGRSHSGGRH